MVKVITIHQKCIFNRRKWKKNNKELILLWNKFLFSTCTKNPKCNCLPYLKIVLFIFRLFENTKMKIILRATCSLVATNFNIFRFVARNNEHCIQLVFTQTEISRQIRIIRNVRVAHNHTHTQYALQIQMRIFSFCKQNVENHFSKENDIYYVNTLGPKRIVLILFVCFSFFFISIYCLK